METTRRTAVIAFADIVKYTEMVSRDEEAGLSYRRRVEALFAELAPTHFGRLVKMIGDAAMLEFPTAMDAVNCCVEALTQMEGWPAETDEKSEAPMVRIGLHFGEVVEEHGDLFGNVVNIAQRVQTMASPGGVCITEAVYQQLTSLGKRQFTRAVNTPEKPMPTDIGVYEMSPRQPASVRRMRLLLRPAIAVFGIVAFIAFGVAIYSTMQRSAGARPAAVASTEQTDALRRLEQQVQDLEERLKQAQADPAPDNDNSVQKRLNEARAELVERRKAMANPAAVPPAPAPKARPTPHAARPTKPTNDTTARPPEPAPAPNVRVDGQMDARLYEIGANGRPIGFPDRFIPTSPGESMTTPIELSTDKRYWLVFENGKAGYWRVFHVIRRVSVVQERRLLAVDGRTGEARAYDRSAGIAEDEVIAVALDSDDLNRNGRLVLAEFFPEPPPRGEAPMATLMRRTTAQRLPNGPQRRPGRDLAQISYESIAVGIRAGQRSP